MILITLFETSNTEHRPHILKSEDFKNYNKIIAELDFQNDLMIDKDKEIQLLIAESLIIEKQNGDKTEIMKKIQQKVDENKQIRKDYEAEVENLLKNGYLLKLTKDVKLIKQQLLML